MTTFNADAEGITTDNVVTKLIQAIPLPQDGASCKVKQRVSVMNIRPYQSGDEAAVIDLWRRCDLLRPWNDPHKT